MGDYKSAYIVLGHGADGEGLVKVPPGCCVVVDAHTGEYTGNEHLSYVMKTISKGNPINKILLNPTKNYEKILAMSQSGSLAIYKEGEDCPDFTFELLSVWNEPTFALTSSGIIQYPFKFDFKELKQYSKTDKVTFDDLIDYYKGGVYPTEHDLREFKAFLKEEFTMPEDADIRDWMFYILLNPNDVGKLVRKYSVRSKIKQNSKRASNDLKTLETIYLNLLKYIKISLSDIFKMITDGRLNPGVLYNLVCRTSSESLSEKALNTEITFGNHFHVSDFFTTSKADRLAETIGHRKQYVPLGLNTYEKVKDRYYQKYSENQNTSNENRVLHAMKAARRRKNKGLRWIKTENGKWVEAPTFTQKVKGKIQNFFTRKRRSNTNTDSGSNTNTLSISSSNTSPKGRIPNHTRRSRLHNLLPPPQSP